MGQKNEFYKPNEIASLSDILFRHLDRMSLNLTDVMDPQKFTPDTSKVATYYFQIQHYENIVHPLLGKIKMADGKFKDFYTIKKDKFVLPPFRKLDNCTPSVAMDYFEKLSIWLKLLQTFAYNNQLLKVDHREAINDKLEKGTGNDSET